jgi:hypothetical protein
MFAHHLAAERTIIHRIVQTRRWKMRASLARRWMLPLAAALAAGCGSYGITGDQSLTPADVQGTYRPCELRFTPTASGLPQVDLLRSVIDTAPPASKTAPRLVLSGAVPEFDLAYTRRGDGVVQHATGDVEFGGHSVFLYLNSRVPTSIQTESLLPQGHLDLVYAAATHRLSAGDEVSAYWVRRSDYTHASGVSEEGLQDRIYGHVSATFSAGGC